MAQRNGFVVSVGVLRPGLTNRETLLLCKRVYTSSPCWDAHDRSSSRVLRGTPSARAGCGRLVRAPYRCSPGTAGLLEGILTRYCRGTRQVLLGCQQVLNWVLGYARAFFFTAISEYAWPSTIPSVWFLSEPAHKHTNK